jgi:hypothetical protein
VAVRVMATKDETQTVLPVVQSEAVVQVQTMEHHLEGPGIVLRQKTSECCRFFTCQPNIDWLIHPPHPHGDASDFGDPRFADTLAAKFWIQEDATYCNRVWSCWAPGCRETTYRTLPTNFAGTSIATDADSLMTHKKGGTCGVNSIVLFSNQGAVRCPMCCCLPHMDTLDNNGERLPVCQHHLLGHARSGAATRRWCRILSCMLTLPARGQAGHHRVHVRPMVLRAEIQGQQRAGVQVGLSAPTPPELSAQRIPALRRPAGPADVHDPARRLLHGLLRQVQVRWPKGQVLPRSVLHPRSPDDGADRQSRGRGAWGQAGRQSAPSRPTAAPCLRITRECRCWRASAPLPASPDSATPRPATGGTITLPSEVGPSRSPGWRHRRSRTCGRV